MPNETLGKQPLKTPSDNGRLVVLDGGNARYTTKAYAEYVSERVVAIGTTQLEIGTYQLSNTSKKGYTIIEFNGPAQTGSGAIGWYVEHDPETDISTGKMVFTNNFTGDLYTTEWVGLDGERSAQRFPVIPAKDFKQGELIVFRLNGTDTFFLARIDLNRADFPGGMIPGPTGQVDDPNWAPATASKSFVGYERLTYDQAVDTTIEEEVVPGRAYRIFSNNLQVGIITNGLFDGRSFNPVALRENGDGTYTQGTYDLQSDEFTEGGSGGGDGAPYTLEVTETIGGLTPGTYTDTDRGFITRMAVKYQAPYFNVFTIANAGSQDVEVGTSFPAGFKSFAWDTVNSQNVTANSILIRNVTANTVLASSEANDGSASISTPGLTATPGEFQRYRIQGNNTQAGQFMADIVYAGYYRLFYGPAAATPTSSAQVRALPANQLTNQGNSFTLNTGNTSNRFIVWLPQGKTITSVVDLDALNADITSQYVGSAFSVNDAGGADVAGTLYVMSPAVAYSTNHRHQITTS